jgi:hypothetical protein
MDQTPNSKPPDATDQAAVVVGGLTQRPRKQRLRWLVLAHVAISLSTGILVASIGRSTGPHLAVAGWVGIVFCQTSLLGIWGGLGTSSWWSRLLGLVVGTGYLGLLLDFCVGGPYRDNGIILSLAIVLVAGVLLIARCFRVRICLTPVAKAAVPPIQFSIRQLLILTFAVACLVTLGKWLGPDLVPDTPSFVVESIGLLLAAVALISVWPVLGTRRPILPSVIAIAAAAGLGFCFARLFPPVVDLVAFWMTITSVEALYLVASLLAVRASGYRLVRLPSSRLTTTNGRA